MRAVVDLDTKKHRVIIHRNFVGTIILYHPHGITEHVGIAAEFDIDAADSGVGLLSKQLRITSRKLTYVFRRTGCHRAGPSNRDLSLQMDLLGENYNPIFPTGMEK